jgi:hypothetical protein
VRAIAAQVRERLNAKGITVTRENVQTMKARIEGYLQQAIASGMMQVPAQDIDIQPGAEPGSFVVSLRLRQPATQEQKP